MDFILILGILFIIIFLVVIVAFVIWYRGKKNPQEYSEYPEDEEYYGEFVEREFRCPNCGVQVEPEELICHECGAEFKEGEY